VKIKNILSEVCENSLNSLYSSKFLSDAKRRRAGGMGGWAYSFWSVLTVAKRGFCPENEGQDWQDGGLAGLGRPRFLKKFDICQGKRCS
jgi:hypothetical protein